MTEERQGGGKNKDGRKVHPYTGPKLDSDFPRVPRLANTERNVGFWIGFEFLATHGFFV